MSLDRTSSLRLFKLDDLQEPDDNTDLDASTARHGLLRKLPGDTRTFLRADGAFAEPISQPLFLTRYVCKR